MMKNQDEESRFYIQNYISQNEEITTDRTRDPRLKLLETKLVSISNEPDPKNEEEMKKLIEQFKSKVNILSTDQKSQLLKQVKKKILSKFFLILNDRDGK